MPSVFSRGDLSKNKGFKMRIRVECDISDDTEAQYLSSGEGIYEFSDLYGQGQALLRFSKNKLFFEKEVLVSQKALEAVARAANALRGRETDGQYVDAWVQEVYKGKVEGELNRVCGSFLKAVWRVTNDMQSVFNFATRVVGVSDLVVIIDDSGVEHAIHPKLVGSNDLSLTMVFNEEHISSFVDSMNQCGPYLYAFNVLNTTKIQPDNNLRIIELAVAAEVGIKEFYSRMIPELEILLERTPSPPIARLYGDVFQKYFNEEFKLSAPIKGLIERRNNLAHSHSPKNASIDEAVKYTKVVQESLAILQSMLLRRSNCLLDNLSTFGKIVHKKGNNFQIDLTPAQKSLVAEGKALGSFKFKILNDFVHG